MVDRTRARELAQRAVREGRPLEWFEELYSEAQTRGTAVPWVDRVPNPLLCRWLDANGVQGAGKRALDVGCGLGDNSEELSRRGFRVTSFDISPTAIALARDRFAASGVEYVTADLLKPPSTWRAAFDFVFEAYTLQVLPPLQRAFAVAALRATVAPGGTLLVIARARAPQEPEGAMPWPLTRSEVEDIAHDGLSRESVEEVIDDEDPPVRRFVAVFARS